MWKAISLGKLAYPDGPELDAARVVRRLCAELPALLTTGWPPIEVHALSANRIAIGPRNGHKVHVTVTDAPEVTSTVDTSPHQQTPDRR